MLRRARIVLALAILAATGCADRVRIDDGAQVGPLTQVKDWFTSVFVLPTDDGAVLFDAGFRAGALERKLGDLGIALGDVTDVFLTHGHGDHIALAEALPGARILALEAERALIDEESDGAVVLTDPVVDGDVIDVGTPVEVFAVPGHTAGSTVYLVGGVLILGDAAIVDRDEQLVPVPEKRSENPAELVASMQALAARLEPRADTIAWLAPAHSAPLQGFAPLADFAAPPDP